MPIGYKLYLSLFIILIAIANSALGQSIPRRSPHNGEFSISGNFAESFFSWLNVGGWQESDPKFELDFAVHKDLFEECTSMTDLPDRYDDCATAGVAEEGDVKVFSVGSHHARNIVSNRRYHAEWMFEGGTISVSEYSIGWQELENRCPIFSNPHLCYFSVAGNTLMKYVLSKSLPDERWWKWRDNALASEGSFRLEPDNAYWSGRPGRHSGALIGPAGTDFDLHLQKWDSGNWVTVASSTSSGSNEPPGTSEWLEYSGQPGYYVWKIVSRRGTGNYQFGSSGPMGGAQPPLSVTLSSSSITGVAPLNDVDLTATLGDSSPWTTSYTFYCDRDDDGVNITPDHDAKYNHISPSSKTAVGICDYPSAGTYTAKVIAERGAAAVEARRIITVGTTSSQVPEITTLAATSVTQTSVTFNATIHPKSSVTTFWFDYGTSTNVSQSTVPQTLAAATSPSAVSISQGGLSCGQQYFYRIRASNAGGPATPGGILSFTTDACGGSQSVQLVADTSFEAGNNAWWVANPAFYINGKPEFPNPRTGNKYAFLSLSNGARGNNLSGGMISPTITIPANATDADLRFWYSITSDETTSTQTNDKLDVYLVLPVNQPILIASLSNLDRNGTSYSQESIDLSSSFYGKNVQIFFAGSTNSSLPTVFRIDDVTLDVDVAASTSPPTVSTEPADQLTASSARLSMTVNPNGAATEVWFDLEAGDSTPNNDTEHLTIGSGSQSETVSISVFNLQCGTLYYFKANASNTNGSNSGTVRSFSTSACSSTPPGADTDPASNIGQTAATLNADVTPNGLSTQAWFAWGTSTSLGQETPRVGVGSSTASADFSQSISGLTCGTTYYFQNRASNSAGQDSGSILSFETLPCDSSGPAQGFFLDSSRQGCSGGGPAVLLWWRAPAGIDNVFTVRRTDGAYSATVNSSQGGMVHLVSSLLVPGQTYSFYVEGTLNGSSVQTNAVTVPVISDECRLPVGTGELPHLPLAWTGTPFCSGGTASVPVQWTAVVGADSYTLTRIDNVAGQLTPYPGLAGTSMVDTGLTPGAAYEYMLDAVGSGGSRRATRISVFIPSGICGGEPATPGPFSAQVSTPVCDAGKGAVTLSWTSATGATSGTHTYRSDDGFTSGLGTTFSGSSDVIDGLRPGALVKLMVQREAAATPLQYRSVILAQRIPLDVCGGGTLPPTVTTVAATYVQERQALLRASVVPNADSSIAYFEWGTSPSLGSTTPLRNTGDGYRSASLGETLTGLACNTTYYFRVTAANAVGQISGSTLELTTKPCTSTLPVVTVTASDPEASEQPLGNGEFLIQRSGSTASDLTVTYSVGGTATLGQDHTLAGGSVVIPAGSSSKALTVSPLDDQVAEADETVIVTLQGQASYEVGQPGSATVTIVSDEVPGGGGCGNVLVQQPRDQFGGCDASDAGIQWQIAENFRLNDRKRISCLEVLGYYWTGNDPPPVSVFDVVIHGIAGDGTPGAVIRENRGIRAQRQKTGAVSFGLEEWRFTIELPSPVELAAGDFFAEISGSAPTGGSFCWIGGQRDPVAGLSGMAFRNTGPWSLGTWDLAFKVFEAGTEIFKDGFETGTLEKWEHQP